jgi:hypothetical protein
MKNQFKTEPKHCISSGPTEEYLCGTQFRSIYAVDSCANDIITTHCVHAEQQIPSSNVVPSFGHQLQRYTEQRCQHFPLFDSPVSAGSLMVLTVSSARVTVIVSAATMIVVSAIVTSTVIVVVITAAASFKFSRPTVGDGNAVLVYVILVRRNLHSSTSRYSNQSCRKAHVHILDHTDFEAVEAFALMRFSSRLVICEKKRWQQKL